MKHLILIPLTIVMLFSCKKGEEDPFLSLKSRENRLIGNWKVEEGLQKTTHSEPDFEYSSTVTYSGDKITASIKFDPNSGYEDTVFQYKGRYYFNFLEDGVFYGEASTAEIDDLPLRGYGSGTWHFMEKNDEYKNKERVEVIYHDSDGDISFKSIYIIQMLKNNELAITSEDAYKDDNGVNITSSEEYTLVKN